MKDIESLIPHRAPFMFVDEITSVDLETITGNRTFTPSEFLVKGTCSEYSFVPGTIIIESMAQCGGAGIKLLGITDGLFGLASIENAVFHNGVEFGDKVTYEIKNIRLGDKIVKQSGVAYVNEMAVASATWVCVRIEQPGNPG